MSAQYDRMKAAVEKALEDFSLLACEGEDVVTDALPYPPAEGQIPQPLCSAMRYSLLLPGKRLRPVLLTGAYALIREDWENALPFACGLEMIHTYSLIHDDLPAMDNSNLRRGRPANHVVYGEATAILAGDGLLTAAFSQLAAAQLPAERIAQAVACLAAAAGPNGMVGGQAMDMAGEGRALTIEELTLLQTLKTGALLSAAAELGCIAAGGSAAQLAAVSRYAQAFGRAFQVRDDMLDMISSEQALGKPTGADRDNEKSTFLSALGLEGCNKLIDQLTTQAIDALAIFAHADFHIWLAGQMAGRTS